jgi:predicted DNA-binding WGR domain protein
MSLDDIYDEDYNLKNSNEEEELLKSINKRHLYGVQRNQYSIEFLRKLNKLYTYDIIDLEFADNNYIKQVGNYYKGKGDFQNMIKYYLIAIEKGDGGSMNNLANYYREIGDIDNMKKYYLMAIDKNDLHSLNNFGKYCNEQGDYETMRICYEKAIEQGCLWGMTRLGYHYWEQKDFNKMEKYYEMAAEFGDIWAMNRLIDYYQDQNDITNLKIYLMMAVGEGDANSKKKLEELNEKEINNMKIEDLIKNKPLFTKMLVEECINYRKLEANNIRMGADWEEIDKARNRRFLLEYFLEDYDSKAWYNLINVQYQNLLAYGFFTGQIPLFTINRHRLMVIDGKVRKI